VRRFILGVIVGALLVIGVAEATPWPGEWKQAPMDAGEFTYLYEHGYCRRGYVVHRVGPRPSNNYECRLKGSRTRR